MSARSELALCVKQLRIALLQRLRNCEQILGLLPTEIHRFPANIATNDSDVLQKQMRDGSANVQALAEDIPLEDNTFDMVFCLFSFRDFQDKKKGLEEIYRVLKPGGQLVICDAGKANYLHGLAGRMWMSTVVQWMARWVTKTKDHPWKGLARGESEVVYDHGLCPVAEQLHFHSFFGLNLCAHEFNDSECDAVIRAFRRVWACLSVAPSS